MRLPIVNLTVDGAEMLAAFEPCEAEHARRTRHQVGAVTATSLLHGLWLLPHGIPVPARVLPDHKVDRLRDATHLVTLYDDSFVRHYVPAGVVRAVAFGGMTVEVALRRAARFTPIVQRFAVLPEMAQVRQATIDMARTYGVGILRAGGDGTEPTVESASAVKGIPAVFRWWIAELAYESWLYDNTQLVS